MLRPRCPIDYFYVLLAAAALGGVVASYSVILYDVIRELFR